MKFAPKKAEGGQRMKQTKIFNFKKIVSMALVVLLAVLIFMPLNSDAGVCAEALTKCYVDAILVSIFTGFTAGLIFSTFCSLGYEWCLRYYE